MLRVVLVVDGPSEQAIAVKESLAMYLERFGDTKCVEITEIPHEQLKLEEVGLYGNKQQTKRR